MRVLMLSTDANILNATSTVAGRMREYGGLFEGLTVLVLGAGKRRVLSLSEKTRVVFPGGRTKREAFKNALWEGMREGHALSADIVTVQDPFFVGFAGWRIAHALHAPLQVQIHTDFMNAAYALSSVRRFFEISLAFFVLSRASCVRVVSKRIAESIRFVPQRKITVLPIPPSPMRDVRRLSLGRGTGEFSVLVVSRLEPEKRVHLALDAFAEWVTSDVTHSAGAMLAIVGEGSERARLLIRARNLGLAERVRFLGWQDDLAPLYAEADIFLQLSRFEGYGLSLIEAGLAALPIITTDVGVVGEVYEKNRDVLVVSGAISETVAAIRRLAEDGALLRGALGERARAQALKELCDEKTYSARFRASLENCVS